jgi:hypothetical protein
MKKKIVVLECTDQNINYDNMNIDEFSIEFLKNPTFKYHLEKIEKESNVMNINIRKDPIQEILEMEQSILQEELEMDAAFRYDYDQLLFDLY